MAQVRCPNCGGYRVTVTTSHFTPRTGQSTYSPEASGCIAGVLGGFAVFGGIFQIAPATFDASLPMFIRIGALIVALAMIGSGTSFLIFALQGGNTDVIEK